ncbi:hypothetical protein PTKIN_Ptkin02bG0117800 [Pterospermum kingtungense]
MFSHSQWVKDYGLKLESDFTNVVKWLNDPGSGIWRFRGIISHIEGLKNILQNWSAVHTYREGNSLADGLTKSRVHRSKDLVLTFSPFCTL